MILVAVETVQFIERDTCIARTPQGHHIVCAFGRPVAICLNNGAIFKRFAFTHGALGHRIDVILSTIVAQEKWNGQVGRAQIAECSEREWIGVEEMAATSTAMPPQPPEITT